VAEELGFDRITLTAVAGSIKKQDWQTFLRCYGAVLAKVLGGRHLAGLRQRRRQHSQGHKIPKKD
jgi:hypothetical protein